MPVPSLNESHHGKLILARCEDDVRSSTGRYFRTFKEALSENGLRQVWQRAVSGRMFFLDYLPGYR
jgi:hypothetical protein